MNWSHDIAIFFGAAFLANFAPHAIAGVLGRPFQSPFAKPPGKGYSSAQLNVVWGFFNLVIAYVLLVRVGDLDLHSLEHVGCALVGAFAMSMMAATNFGKYNGGNDPLGEQAKRDAGKTIS